MYKITCDRHIIFDTRLEDYIVLEPKVNVETNTVGECSFIIYNNHPHYNDMHPLKSMFEVSDENGVIFRGRMTNNTKDFYNGKAVDLEGAMAFFNDSMVKPFVFPDDFSDASSSRNVVEYFLNWLIENHNSQVQDFQKFQLGDVTVTDPNNYISRSSENIASTWTTLKEKLFESNLGGYLCIRYGESGNYIDYLADFDDVNTQEIKLGENLLDMKYETDASTTYSAIIPIGADIEVEGKDGKTTTKKLTLESIADGRVSSSQDIYKVTLENGLHALYDDSAVYDFGWICCPIEDSTWDDVTDVNNLKNKAVAFLSGAASLMSSCIEVTAADLHFTDAEISSFRLYKKVKVTSKPHGIEAHYNLTRLEIDLLNPQNTKVVVGTPAKTLTSTVSGGGSSTSSGSSGTGGGGGIAEETDPTVPAWAKQPNKPEYTAAEVGALPSTTKIPSKTSDLTNDSGFLTYIPATYVTEEELEAKHYLTSVPDSYVTKNDLDNRGYLTESDLDVELDQFATEAEVEAAIDSKGFLTDSDLDTKLDTFVTEADLDSRGFVTEADLVTEGFAKQKDLDSLSGDIQDVSTNLSTEIRQLAEDIPTKTSDLTNDSGFLTAVPSEYVTETELANKKYLTSVPSEYVTETELEAKKYLTSIPTEYLTESDVINNLTSSVINQPLSAKQGNVLKGLIDSTEKKIPTKTSALTNDSGFLTSIPSEYITETELSGKGYLTAIPSEYVTETELAGKDYLTETKLNLGVYGLVKTVNNLKPDANGNVDVLGEDGSLKHTHTWADIAATYEDLVVTSDGANHGGYVKVSNEALTLKDIENGGSVSFIEGAGALTTLKFPDELTVYERTNGAVIAFNGLPLVVIAFEDGMTYMGNTFEKGISFAQDSIVITHTFRLNDYVLSSEITPIPPEYLPIDFLRQLILEVTGSGGEGGLLDSNGNYLYDVLNNKLIAKE